jgi:hypothetical protein
LNEIRIDDFIERTIDPISTPDPVARALMGGDLQIEIRGYEVARFTPGGWQVVGKYRSHESGQRAAVQTAEWLQERHPGETYRVRPIVSLDPIGLMVNKEVPAPGTPGECPARTAARG